MSEQKATITNFVLAGVGGQGILLAADLVALAGLEMGLDVKKSEIHGMAQRGGSVSSQVRWGARVYSPLIVPGEVDYLLTFERLETLRYAEQLRPGGVILINDYRISPVSVTSGADAYPTREEEERAYGGIAHHYIPAMAIAQELGNPRVNNVVLLGALSALLDVPQDIWFNVIAQRVPERFVALNQQAFAAGQAYLRQDKGQG